MSDFWANDPVVEPSGGADQFWANDPIVGSETKPAPMSWSDVGKRALQNAPASAVKFGEDVIQPIVHPIDTAKGIWDTSRSLAAEGAAAFDAGVAPYVPGARVYQEPTFGGRYDDALGDTSKLIGADPKFGNAVGEYIKGRYGGVENIKRSIASDPVGVVGDAAMALGGAGGALARAPGVIGKVGEVARAVGDVINPLKPVTKAVEGAASAVAANPVVNYIRGSRDPEGEAARRVADWRARDEAAGSTGLSEQEQAAARAAGQPVMNIDRGGEGTRALARSAANNSPEARGTLTSKIAQRFQSQGDRVAEWLGSTFDHPDSDATKQSLQDAARTVNKPAYAKAYAAGGKGIWNDDLAQISQAPVVQDAIRKTMVSAKNEAAKLGFAAPQNPFRADKEGRIFLGKDNNGRQLTPSLQFWDHVKRNLDATGTRDAKDWARVLREHLDGQVPEYATARAGAAKAFGAQDALEAGRNAASSTAVKNREMQAALSKMTEVEKRLFRTGFVDDFITKVGDVSNRRNILNSISASPNATARLKIALGSEKAAEFEAFLRTEGIMDLARSAVQGGSTTTRQLAELGLAQSDFFEGLGHIPMSTHGVAAKLISAVLSKASKALQTKVDKKVADHIAKLLTSGDIATVNRGVRIVSRNKATLDALREFDKQFARVAGVGRQRGTVTVTDN